MIVDLDIYRSAKLLVDQHGDRAPIHAAMRADEMLDEGDMEGRAVWLRIVKAVGVLLDTEPPGARAAIYDGRRLALGL